MTVLQKQEVKVEKGGTGSEKRFDSAISKSLCSVVKKTVNNCEGLFSVYWNYLEVRRKKSEVFHGIQSLSIPS